MDKYVFDNSNGLWYERIGDYYIPCLTLPTEEEKSIGIYGQRHLRYLKEYQRATYTNLLTSSKLNSYLAGIDRQAKDTFSRLVTQMAENEGATEQLKTDDQILWVGKMSAIREAVAEIVNNDLIFA